MPFHDPYTIKQADNLTRIGQEYGFPNPGPIYNYPPNKFLLRAGANSIQPGMRIQIPYHPDLLRKIIATSRFLIDEITKTTTKFMQDQDVLKKDIEEFLFMIDAMNFLVSVGAGIGVLAIKGAKVGTMSGKEAILWFAESRASILSNIATSTIPAPNFPKKDFKFYVRHALGPWNPSFWASVVGAVDAGDVDVYLYGQDAVIYKEKLKIKRQAEADIARLRIRMGEARSQISQSYYKSKV